MALWQSSYVMLGSNSTTFLDRFWQTPFGGGLDPSIPNLPLELVPLTAALSATESSDTVAFDVGLSGGAITASLAATESSDVVAVNVTNKTTATLAATESSDVVAFNVTNKTTATLAATESSDTVAFNVTLSGGTITAALAVTEPSDVAAFSVQSAEDRITGGAVGWRGTLDRIYRVHPEYADPRPKKKKVKKSGEQVILAGEPEIHTGVIEVQPARDVLGELQRQKDEAERVRRAKLRAI